MKNKKLLTTRLLTVFLLIQSAWQPLWADFLFEESLENRHFELKAGVGGAWVSADQTSLHVTQYETDELSFDQANGWAATLGVAYVIPTDVRFWEKWKWLSAVKLSLDLTQQFAMTMDGEVFLYGDHDFEGYDTDTRVDNTNLIANVSLNVAQYNDIYFFIMGGIGMARTNVTYDEVPEADVNRGNLKLDKNTTYTAVLQGGGGLGYSLTPRLNVTFTYLYTDIGDVRTGDTGDTDDIAHPAIQSATINLRQQTALLGLEYIFW